ncbi:DUF3482 domain-containing protein [Corticibacter populi]|uniref:DUF3482 domain-containing protein n=1 Tax=Corticibacter populi TaxID=1550736 RepID=UPI0013C2D119|nr:DUF3482 domain-containing protein [Corticibacter populi]
MPAQTRIQWCLISHTNIGKTSLARTLLMQDVGDIRDAAHVTDSADAHVLLETSAGDILTLWDTPGFGDSVRLYQRLRQQSNPLGWFLSNVWDRWRDKPFWMSQRAMRAARDNADVVLYLVNAAEDPADAGYLDAEMHILQWLGKPVFVLLNQLGQPQPGTAQQADVERWHAAVRPYQPMVRGVLALDAFTRSWVHEQSLFHAVQAAIAPDKQAAYARIVQAWETRNQQRFAASMACLATLLAEATGWTQPISEPVSALSWKHLQNAMTSKAGAEAAAENDPARQAMQALLRRLQKADEAAMQTLLQLHRLDGHAAAQIQQQLNQYFTVQQPLDARQMGLLGALTTGAASGFGADLATGGLSMGTGALIGALAGAAAFAGAALGLNKWRAQSAHQVHLSDNLLDELLRASLLKYLAIAHFGRGRGSYTANEAPAHWNAALGQALASRQETLHALWRGLREQALAEAAAPEDPALRVRLENAVTATALDTLGRLYPSLQLPGQTAADGTGQRP